MPPRKPIQIGRATRAEDMVVSQDSRSMRKGRRVAPRTEVCRACLIWPGDAAGGDGERDEGLRGVVLDLNPHGMRIRSLESFAFGDQLVVQLMRDEEYLVPLSTPLLVRIIRVSEADGFYDYGVKLVVKRIRKPAEVRPAKPVLPRPTRRMGTRMYTADYAVDDAIVGKTGRSRG